MISSRLQWDWAQHYLRNPILIREITGKSLVVLGFKYQTFDLELGIEKILLDFMSEPIHSIVLYALASKIFCYCRYVGVALSTRLLTRRQGIRIPNRS